MPQGRHPTESKTSPRRIRAVEKQRQALELRMGGRTYAEIAKVLHYANHTGAEYAVRTALQKTLEPTAHEFRALALERLSKILSLYWLRMINGDDKATDRVFRAIADVRQLLGLDAPQKVDVNLQHTLADLPKLALEAQRLGVPSLN